MLFVKSLGGSFGWARDRDIVCQSDNQSEAEETIHE